VDARIGQQSLGAGKPYGGDDKQRDTDDDESETLTMHGRTRRFFEPQAAAHAELGGVHQCQEKEAERLNNEAEGDDRHPCVPRRRTPVYCGVIGITFDHETPPCAAFKIWMSESASADDHQRLADCAKPALAAGS
jgi:hypothetical protein